MRLSKTTRYSRHTYGDDGVFGRRNIVSVSFAATDLGQASSVSLLSEAAAGDHTVTSQPNVPRNVAVQGVAEDTGDVVVTGKNAEGATISETIALDGDTVVQGDKAFASITNVSVPADATVTVTGGNKFGVNHRILSASSVKVLVIDADGSAELEDAAAVTTGAAAEANTVTLTTAPGSGRQYRVYSLTHNWHADPINGQPVYGV